MISTGRAIGQNLSALSTKLLSARSSCPRRTATTKESFATTVTARPVRRLARKATSVATSPRSTADGSSTSRWSLASAESSLESEVSSSTSARMSRNIASRVCASSVLRSSSSVLARNEVSGVRSSWLASCTSCFCCSPLRRKALSMVLKLSANCSISRSP